MTTPIESGDPVKLSLRGVSKRFQAARASAPTVAVIGRPSSSMLPDEG